MDRNISYEDMLRAVEKNNIPENQQQAVIMQSYGAVFAGTKAQKIAVFTSLMNGYGITVKQNQ